MLSSCVILNTQLTNFVLRVGRYVFRVVFNRGLNLTAIFKANRKYDIQIARVQKKNRKDNAKILRLNLDFECEI